SQKPGLLEQRLGPVASGVPCASRGHRIVPSEGLRTGYGRTMHVHEGHVRQDCRRHRGQCRYRQGDGQGAGTQERESHLGVQEPGQGQARRPGHSARHGQAGGLDATGLVLLQVRQTFCQGPPRARGPTGRADQQCRHNA
ncbi:unnamed protein product, partial [Ixodes pacificus]